MFNWFNNKIQKYFGISKTESNGLLILFLGMVLLIFSPFVYRQFDRTPYSGFIEDSLRLDSLIRLMEAETKSNTPETEGAKLQQRRFMFDPNHITYNELLLLGFDTLVAKRLIKYRNKGGRFNTREDLIKIYGLREDFYSSLKTYIDLPYRTQRRSNASDYGFPGPSNASGTKNNPDSITRDKFVEEIVPLSIDINKADTLQLKQVKGVGSVYSKRIIKYRDLLGGYVHLDQLNEVYGLREETLLNLKNSLFIDTLFMPVKININFAEWADLVRHPYINSNLANDIIDTRSVNGPYRRYLDMQRISIINDSILNRIKPYVKF